MPLSGQIDSKLESHSEVLTGVAWSAKRQLAACSEDRTMVTWEEAGSRNAVKGQATTEAGESWSAEPEHGSMLDACVGSKKGALQHGTFRELDVCATQIGDKIPEGDCLGAKANTLSVSDPQSILVVSLENSITGAFHATTHQSSRVGRMRQLLESAEDQRIKLAKLLATLKDLHGGVDIP